MDCQPPDEPVECSVKTLNQLLDQCEVVEEPGGCWMWRGATRPEGYGQVNWRGRVEATHRVTYALLVEPIPAGMEIDHLCGYPGCCNPDHLEMVAGEENRRRQAERKGFRPRREYPSREGAKIEALRKLGWNI